MAHLTKIYRHPVKGCRGERVNGGVYLDNDALIMGDRQFAFRYKNLDAGASWAGKTDFLCAMTHPDMARWQARYDTDRATLTFTCKRSQETVVLDDVYVRDHDLHLMNDDVTAMARKFGFDGETVSLMGQSWRRGAQALTDQEENYISVGNVMTLRALASKWDISEHPDFGIHPARFGINLWVNGLPPFSEWKWVEELKPLSVNDRVVLQPIKHIDRCAKVNASPYTGARDQKIFTQLKREAEKRNWQIMGKHTKVHAPLMGVFFKVMKGGSVAADDQVVVHDT